MSKSLKFLTVGSIFLIFLALLVWTVWGQTIRIFQANKLFKAKAYDQAETIYEDLAVEIPANRVISHNLGLCLYQAGLYERAIQSFSKAVPQKTTAGLEAPIAKSAGIYYYHFGNALYKAAFRNGVETETSVKLLKTALENYKKALSANSNDEAARYNYELTMLHLKELAEKPKNQQNQQQEVDNLLQNVQNSEQYKVKLIRENSPPGGKDW